MGDWHHPQHYTDAAKAFALDERRAHIALFVDRVMPAMRDAARGLGYALAIHGSQARDLDLVAIPWTDDAGEVIALAEAIAAAVKAATGWGMLDKIDRWDVWDVKPHGRVAMNIVASFALNVDLSIMPKVKA